MAPLLESVRSMGSMLKYPFTALRTLAPPADNSTPSGALEISYGQPPRRRHPALFLLIIVVAGLAGVLGWWAFLSPITVSAVPVEANVREQVYGLGVTGARVQSNVTFKVAGVLIELKADQGDRAWAGQVLARLDARDVEAQLALSRAAVGQARANIEKAKADVASAATNLLNAKAIAARRAALVKNAAISVEEAQTTDTAARVAEANLTSAQAAVTVAEAALQSAEAQQAFEEATLSYYTLYAPYDAWIISRNLELGSVVNPFNASQSVFTLVAARTVWLVGYVDERLAGRLSVGQPADIILRSHPNTRIPGHVERIEIQSDPVNEERLVDVAFDRIPENIHLAEQAYVYVTTDTLPRAVSVQLSAIIDFRGDKSIGGHGTVWTVEQGRIERRPVAFGPELLEAACRFLKGCPPVRCSCGAGPRAAPWAGRTFCGGLASMNLAIREIQHNLLRFVLTGLGLGGLLGIVVTMAGIYAGALDDALRLPRASSSDLWVVQPRTKGPFAEPSRIPRDTRELVQRIPGVAAAGVVTFQSVQTIANGRPLRLYVQGYEPGRLGGPPPLVAGHGITESHYQIVADASTGLKLGDQVPLGPYADPYIVVGMTRGMVNSAGDPVAWITLLDAQTIQFAVAPPLQRREKAAGRSPLVTADINAVLLQLHPGVPKALVVQEIDRWKHLSAVTQQQEEDYLTVFVIEKMRKQLAMYMVILIVVSAVIISLIIYMLTMDKLRSIATLKLIGAPDRTIIGLIVQQALALGVSGFALGVALTATFKSYFPRRVQMEPRDAAILFVIVIVMCLLASALSVRAAVRVDPATALASG